MKSRLAPIALAALCLVAGNSFGQNTTNLLLNPGAESGVLTPWVGSRTSTAFVDNGTFDPSIKPHTGKYDFAGGTSTGALTQQVNLIGNQGITAQMIDAGTQRAYISYWQTCLAQGGVNDTARVRLAYFDGTGSLLGESIMPEQASPGVWTHYRQVFAIPVGTRVINYTMEFLLHAGSDLDAFIDDNVLRVGETVGATAVSNTFYWTNYGNTNGYGYGSFTWDGNTLTASTKQLGEVGAFTLAGSLKVGSDGFIYSGRVGNMYQIQPAISAYINVASGVNNTVTSIDPAGTTVYGGWDNTGLATLATGEAFGPGTPHAITGDEAVASGLAWDSNGKVYYTTGGDTTLGNFGSIDLSTYKTTRVLSGISATEIAFDPYTGHLFTAGIDGIAQIDPATGRIVSTWKNPRGRGLYIKNLSTTGKGHLVAFDSNGLLRLWDFSAGPKLIGAPETITKSVGTRVLDGGLAFAALPGPPQIISPLSLTTYVNQPFVYQLETTGPTRTRNATNLPAGLSFDSKLNAVVGAPAATGSYSITLAASNNFGGTTKTLVLKVQDVPQAGPRFINSTAATGRTGQPFDFQVITAGATAAARLSATGLPPGLTVDPVTGVIEGTVAVDGSFAVTLTLVDGNNTASATLQLTFETDSSVPVIISPQEATVQSGKPFSYKCVAPTTDPGPKIFTLIGNLPAGLGFDTETGEIFGTYSPIRSKDGEPVRSRGGGGVDLSGGIVTNVQLFCTNSSGTGTIPLVFFLAPSGVVNISTRLSVGTGENVLIAGFIITGNAPKKVIIRAIGPSLKAGGVPLAGALQDPTLELRDSGNNLLGSNDDWRMSQEQEIIDTTVPPPDNRESALVAILQPGRYTATIAGKGGMTGIGLAEVYDLGTASLDASSAAQLANISTRGFVQPGDNVIIGGFIVSGGSAKVLLRAIGPSLANSGVANALLDPTLELRDGSGSLVVGNDDWRTGGQEQQIIDSTVPPTDDRESALIATLNGGNYTAVVRGKGNNTGVALVEVYRLQ
jgi:hypothetical protein